MAHLILLLLGIILASIVLDFFGLWAAARCMAGSRATFFSALKCELYLFVLTIGAAILCGIFLVLTYWYAVFYLGIAALCLLALALGFLIPMRIFDIGFFRTLGIIGIRFALGVVFNQMVSIFALPVLKPMIERDAPAITQQIQSFARTHGRGTTAAPPVHSTAVDLARQDVENAQAQLAGLEIKATQAYAGLSEKRKNLDTKNQEAVHAFNLEAADYARIKAKLAEQTTELARLKQQENLLLAQQQAKDELTNRDVVIYTTSWCPACKAAKQAMAERNIPYREVDVEASQSANEEYRRAGGTGTIPLLVIKGRTMPPGFDPHWLDQI